MNVSRLQSQITFLYYKNPDEAFNFYENIMKFELCENQGAAKIFRIAPHSFIGIVDEKHGHWKTREENAVLITLVTTDVESWYDYLKNCGVRLLTEVTQPEKFPVSCFFFEDPGGYHLEIQKFLLPETAVKFS